MQAQSVIGRQKDILRVLHQRDTRENFLRLVFPAPLGNDRGLCKIRDGAAAAGGGVVEVTVTGKREVTKVNIDPEAVDPDDVEMLEDLIMAATNEALRKCEEESQAQMSKITGGLSGLTGGLF